MQIGNLKGLNYSLKPVSEEDASFIIKARLEDSNRNRFIHKISSSIDDQIQWIKDYKNRSNEFYFVVINNISSEPEGLISLYNISNDQAEWGRWVILKNSFAAIESIALIFKFAFDKLKLNKVYSLTIKDNVSTVSLHDSLKEKKEGILKNYFKFYSRTYDAVKHYVDSKYYYEFEKKYLLSNIIKLWRRNCKQICGNFIFDHLGIATDSILDEYNFFEMLGYSECSCLFEDKNQGIVGQFLSAKSQPTIELLENSCESHTLDHYLGNGIKIYHYGYLVENFDACCQFLSKSNFKLVKKPMFSSYFKKRIAFFMYKNLFLIEIIGN